MDILDKHLAAISAKKYDLRLNKNYQDEIHIKDNNPVYNKQIPESHLSFIEKSLDKWLKLGSGYSSILSLQFSRPKNKDKVSLWCKISENSTTTNTTLTNIQRKKLWNVLVTSAEQILQSFPP
jgi:hypothetical protein